MHYVIFVSISTSVSSIIIDCTAKGCLVFLSFWPKSLLYSFRLSTTYSILPSSIVHIRLSCYFMWTELPFMPLKFRVTFIGWSTVSLISSAVQLLLKYLSDKSLSSVVKRVFLFVSCSPIASATVFIIFLVAATLAAAVFGL